MIQIARGEQKCNKAKNNKMEEINKIVKEFGNKLIAEFMGYEKVTVGYFGSEDETEWQCENEEWMDKNELESVGDYGVNIKDNKWFMWDDIKYDSSWDWLMPVLIKIEQEFDVVTSIQINKYKNVGHKEIFGECNICLFAGMDKNIVITDASLKIEAVWKAIVEFIEWYNLKEK